MKQLHWYTTTTRSGALNIGKRFFLLQLISGFFYCDRTNGLTTKSRQAGIRFGNGPLYIVTELTRNHPDLRDKWWQSSCEWRPYRMSNAKDNPITFLHAILATLTDFIYFVPITHVVIHQRIHIVIHIFALQLWKVKVTMVMATHNILWWHFTTG